MVYCGYTAYIVRIFWTTDVAIQIIPTVLVLSNVHDHYMNIRQIPVKKIKQNEEIVWRAGIHILELGSVVELSTDPRFWKGDKSGTIDAANRKAAKAFWMKFG